MTVISLEELGNKFDSIEMGEWYDHFMSIKTCHFRTQIELQLENVFLPYGIDTDPQTERVNGRMLLEGVPEHVSTLVARLEKSLSKCFEKPSTLLSRVRLNQFKTKIRSNTKVIDGITGDPILEDPLELDLKENMVSAVIHIRGLWKSKHSYGLLSQIVKLTVYPKNFAYHKRSIIGVIG